MMRYIVFLLFASLHLSMTIDNTSELTIEISGIDLAKKGNLRIGFFHKEGFPEPEKVVLGKIVAVHSNPMTIHFPKINGGNYAIAVLQDQDKNGKMSKNLMGYPIEPYGFSNNKFGTFGPPDYTDVAITLKQGHKHFISINLK